MLQLPRRPLLPDAERGSATAGALALTVTALLALFAPLCAGDQPYFVAAECFGEPFENTEGVRCGYVFNVPLDVDDPTAGTHVVPVAQVMPRGDSPITDAPVLRLQGGPGFGIVDDIDGWAESDLTELFGVVLLDYRGERRAFPRLACPEKAEALLANLGTVDPFPIEAGRVAEALGTCAERARAEGVDLTHYDTEAIADDIEAVRIALGVEQWNVIGISYGTTTAMEVMRRHPDSVRSVILDSVYPPERNTIADVQGGLDYMLETLDEFCPAETPCNPSATPISEQFHDVVAALDAAPKPGTLDHPVTGEPVPVLFDGGDFANAVWLTVWSENFTLVVPGIIAAGTDDNVSGYLELVYQTQLSELAELDDSSAQLMADVVECRDRGGRLGFDAIADAVAARPEFNNIFQYATYVGHGINCEAIDAGQAPAAWTDSLVSDLPTLVLAGRWDAVTPPAWGEALLPGLSNGRFYEYPGLAHGTWAVTDCTFSIARQFLTDPTAEIDASCVPLMRTTFPPIAP